MIANVSNMFPNVVYYMIITDHTFGYETSTNLNYSVIQGY